MILGDNILISDYITIIYMMFVIRYSIRVILINFGHKYLQGRILMQVVNMCDRQSEIF